jgi:1-pyrroline-5-carboxylate dehydrogenase
LHTSANPKQVATGIVRGAFEFQGQKMFSSFKILCSHKVLWLIKEQIITDEIDENGFS